MSEIRKSFRWRSTSPCQATSPVFLSTNVLIFRNASDVMYTLGSAKFSSVSFLSTMSLILSVRLMLDVLKN